MPLIKPQKKRSVGTGNLFPKREDAKIQRISKSALTKDRKELSAKMQILGAKEDARQLQIMLRKPLYRNRAINKLLTKRLGGTISHTSTRKLLKTKKELETELITLKEKNPRSEEVQILFAQIDEINFFLHERHSDTNSK